MIPHTDRAGAGWQASAVKSTKVRLVPGATYRFGGIEGPGRNGEPSWSVPPGEFRLLGLGRHISTYQDTVVFLDETTGELYCCNLVFWEEHFVLDLHEKGTGI